MKKLFFLMVFTLLSVNVFSQFLREEWVSTSEGRYKCRSWYRAKDTGTFEEWASIYQPSLGYSSLDKLSNGQWECVRIILSRYQTNKGDIFVIFVEWEWRNTWRTVVFICEFTSNTQYRYRAFLFN